MSDLAEPRRRKLATDPQVALRAMVLRLAGGCDVCGDINRVDLVAREMGLSHHTLKKFLRDRRRLLQQSTVERVEWWVWRQLHPEAVYGEDSFADPTVVESVVQEEP